MANGRITVIQILKRANKQDDVDLPKTVFLVDRSPNTPARLSRVTSVSRHNKQFKILFIRLFKLIKSSFE